MILVWPILFLAAVGLFLKQCFRLPEKGVRVTWAVLILLSGLFLARPQENIIAGEDPGAYLNTASTLARLGSFTYTDSMLEALPEPVRNIFFYGNHAYGDTKDGVMKVRSVADAVIQPWFHPAYPLLMVFPIKVFGFKAALYVVPFFALLSALLFAWLIRAVAGCHRLAIIGFLLYLFNPVMAWNARCPRPEILAGFCLLCGLTALLMVYRNHPRASWAAWLGGFLYACGLLFHITVIYTLPVVIAAAFLLGRGGYRFLLGTLPGWGLFLVQTYAVTDPYHLADNLAGWEPWVVMALVVAAGLYLAKASRAGTFPRPLNVLSGRWPVILFLVICTVLYFFRPKYGKLPFLSEGSAAYLSLLPVERLPELFSWPFFILGLLGWLVLIPRFRVSAAVVFLVLVPPVLFPGWMQHYMFETRRVTAFVVPLLAMGSLGALLFLQDRLSAKTARVAVPVAVLLMLSVMAYGRTTLYRLHDLKGMVDAVDEMAEAMPGSNRVVFADYTALTAPLEHIHGIPQLALDTDRRFSEHYLAAAREWKALLTDHPDWNAYYLTPFGPPMDDGLAFAPVREFVFPIQKLSRATRRIPGLVRDKGYTFGLYRVALGRDEALSAYPMPFVNEYNMTCQGTRSFSTRRAGPREAHGGIIPSGEPLRFAAPPAPGSRLILFGSSDDVPGIASDGGKRIDLGGGWFAIDTMAANPTITKKGKAVLTDAWELNDGKVRKLEAVGLTPAALSLPSSHARWTEADSGLLLPLGEASMAALLVGKRRTSEWDQEQVNVTYRGSRLPESTYEVEQGWHWHLLPITPGEHGIEWVNIVVDPAWNPQSKDFPDNLGLMVSRSLVF